ncbi:glycosyltransferase family 39 protein [Micromonospora sp. WMMD812]|uniref:glycosyltransferase family 39 protein n=1 Tax=Micromonospora sp. WMMD812 TaxID=3015152 RepID=UPI00248D31A7|nr:glycosyltransferase family 39 protein [Micromonospora sp. WMMD812]WBB69024.1 glycosyltransferase family 39 protein [Micromonospora sp. WMMD812]
MSDSAVATDTHRPSTGAEQPEPARAGRDGFGELVRRVALSAWFAPTAFAALVVTWHIGKPEMWHDELVTVDVATRSTRQILRLLENVDAVHGAYYLFMHAWTTLVGAGPTAVRLPSALAMTVATACVALAGQRLFDRTTGVAAGFVFALVPTVTRFGQETRSYALVVLGAALATLFLLRALERPGLWRWAAYTLTVAALGVLNVVSLTLLLGHGVAVLVHWWRQRRLWLLVQFALSVGAGLGLALPVIMRGMRQAGRQISWIPDSQPWTVWEQTVGSTLLAAALTALAALGLLAHLRRRPGTTSRPATAALIAVLPLPVILVASTGEINYFFSKYLLFVLPAWAVLAGAGVAALRRVPLVAAALVVVAALAVPGQQALRAEFSHGWYTYPQARAFQPLSYSEAARLIAAEYQPGDGMAAGGPWWWMHDPGVRYYLPKDITPRNVFQARSAADRAELFGADCPEPARCLRDEPRIWVVLPKVTDEPLTGLPRKQSAALAERYDVVRVEHPRGLTVALLQRKG